MLTIQQPVLSLLGAVAAQDTSFAQQLWSAISSPVAMGIYVVVVLLAVMILVAAVLVGDRYAEQMAEPLPETSTPEADSEETADSSADESSEEDGDDEDFILPELHGEADAEAASDATHEEAAEETSEETSAEKAPTNTSRFYMLSEIDRRMESYERPAYDDSLTLEEICDRFREFAAHKLGLYYDISDIRRFIAGLSVTHILIMQGMSGTGKTSLAYAFGEFLQNQSVIVPIQPMWKERTDMIGYYNEFTKRFNETVLLRKMYEADCNDEIYITVLDEMNIARVEYYFAEFLSLLEIPNPDKRYLDVVSDKWEDDPKMLRDGQIQLPPNMWFVGTANNDDSTFAISDKVYDRAIVMNLDKKAEVFDAPDAAPVKLSFAHLTHLIDEARETYALTERNRRRLTMLDEYLMEKFRITFGNRIVKQINQYIPVCLACGGDELDALDDILSRKVLRKLEAQNPVYVRSAADGLCTYLDDLFGTDRMPLCKEYLRRLERTA